MPEDSCRWNDFSKTAQHSLPEAYPVAHTNLLTPRDVLAKSPFRPKDLQAVTEGGPPSYAQHLFSVRGHLAIEVAAKALGRLVRPSVVIFSKCRILVVSLVSRPWRRGLTFAQNLPVGLLLQEGLHYRCPF